MQYIYVLTVYAHPRKAFNLLEKLIKFSVSFLTSSAEDSDGIANISEALDKVKIHLL